MNVIAVLARLTLIAIVAIIGTIIGLNLRQPAQAPGAQAPRTHVASITPTPVLPEQSFSLTIPAQRAKNYPGSIVTTESPLTNQDGFKMGTISYESDGLKIYAAVLLPLTPPPPGGYPGIIFDHGYVLPSGYTTLDPFYTDFASGFAKAGYAVFMPDYRGYGSSWGIPEGAFYSAGYVSDTLNMAASLAHYPSINISQLNLVGHSMGGHVALMAALVRPQEFRSVILAAGSVGTLSDMYENWQAFSDFGDPVTLGIRKRVIELFGAPNDAVPFWKAADPYTYLSELHTPVLLAQDPNDDTVPFRFSEELDQALDAAGHPTTLTRYDGGHSFDGDARPALYTEATNYIKANLNRTGK